MFYDLIEDNLVW